MKYVLKLFLIIISFIFCLESTANDKPGKTVPENVFAPLTIPEEVWTKIPENIDFIGHADGTRLPILLMKKKIKQELKKHFYLQGLKYYDIANKYYLFGSTKRGYCGLIILSSNQEAGKIFQVLTSRIKEKHTIKINGTYAVSAKEKLLLNLYSENLLLIVLGETDLKKFVSRKSSPILKELSSSHISSAYFKGDFRKTPFFQDYALDIPELYGFKEARMVFNLITISMDSEFVFSDPGEAAKVSSILEQTIQLISGKYPDFRSTIIKNTFQDTIRFSFSNKFFSAVKRIAKDPEFRKHYKKTILKNR